MDSKWHPYFKGFSEERPISAPAEWLARCSAEIRSDQGAEKEFAVFRFPYPDTLSLPTFRFFADGRFVRSNIFQSLKEEKLVTARLCLNWRWNYLTGETLNKKNCQVCFTDLTDGLVQQVSSSGFLYLSIREFPP